MSDLVSSVSTKSNYDLVFKSVVSFEPAPAPAGLYLCVRMNIVKPVFCNLRASSLAKSMFINLNAVRSANVCNAVKSEFFESFMISNHGQVSYPKTNVISSSRTKSSPSYSTSNPRFFPLVISSRSL